MVEADSKPWYETAFGAHYRLLYQHRDEAEARRCLDLLPTLAPLTTDLSRQILDLGCGDGRHADWLKRDGWDVVGIDLSADLLATARQRNSADPLPLIRGDMRTLPCSDGVFGSVLSLFTAFGYFGDLAANAQPVGEIARVLPVGGHWFLDYFDSNKVLAELGDGQPKVQHRTVGCLQISETRRYLAETKNVTKEVYLRPVKGELAAARHLGVGENGLRYTERVQVFSLEEIDRMAAGAGLKRVASAGDYHGAQLGQGDRWLLVYQKVQASGDGN